MSQSYALTHKSMWIFLAENQINRLEATKRNRLEATKDTNSETETLTRLHLPVLISAMHGHLLIIKFGK
jgi:hypothetical protein